MRFLALRLSLLAALAGLSVTAAHGQEWTRFRGPNGTGESETTTIPAQWTDSDGYVKAGVFDAPL